MRKQEVCPDYGARFTLSYALFTARRLFSSVANGNASSGGGRLAADFMLHKPISREGQTRREVEVHDVARHQSLEHYSNPYIKPGDASLLWQRLIVSPPDLLLVGCSAVGLLRALSHDSRAGINQ
jgi:hypothetical protein